MKEEPVTRRCAEILRARTHAVIGVSPFNSYFSEERIAALAAWAQRSFASFHVYVPDGPSQYTLEALGYPETRARKKAKRQGRWLLNKIRRALAAAGVEESAIDGLILCSKTLEGCQTYRSLLRDVEDTCARDAAFLNGCYDTSRWVLNGQADAFEDITHDMLVSAVRYFQAELPLFMNSPKLAGVNSSVFVYHQCPPFLEQLLQTRRGDVIDENQGFVKVIAEEAAALNL